MPSANDPLIVVGHADCKRVAFVQAALARLGRPSAVVVPWRDLLDGSDDLARHVRPGSTVRLESPGRDFGVERLLLAAGADVPDPDHPDAARIDPADALRLDDDKGLIRYPRQWYRGFRATLDRLRAAVPGVRWMNDPADVAVMFDKRICQRHFADAGIAVPASLGPVRSCDEVLAAMRERGVRRAFVKLASGSSASGVAALALVGGRLSATTTAEPVRSGGVLRLYNSRRIRTLTEPAVVSAVIDALCREGVQAEEWLPKARTAGGEFDLRVVTVAGQPRHIVVRVSPTPMTNLHLLNERGDLNAVWAAVPATAWDAAMAACAAAASCFPASHQAGVDVMFAAGHGRHAVLEINAFGDLLPGLLLDGRDTYEEELTAWFGAEGP